MTLDWRDKHLLNLPRDFGIRQQSNQHRTGDKEDTRPGARTADHVDAEVQANKEPNPAQILSDGNVFDFAASLLVDYCLADYVLSDSWVLTGWGSMMDVVVSGVGCVDILSLGYGNSQWKDGCISSGHNQALTTIWSGGQEEQRGLEGTRWSWTVVTSGG
jgi:hypothetical protein